MQACKPGSVPARVTGWCLSFIWSVRHRRDLSAYPITPAFAINEPLITFMSVTYLAFQLVRFAVPPLLPLGRWALTPPFHLFPSRQSRAVVVYFLWHCLFRQLADLPVRKYDALRCPDFPY